MNCDKFAIRSSIFFNRRSSATACSTASSVGGGNNTSCFSELRKNRLLASPQRSSLFNWQNLGARRTYRFYVLITLIEIELGNSPLVALKHAEELAPSYEKARSIPPPGHPVSHSFQPPGRLRIS